MPKRRLGYGEVVVGEGTAPQSRTKNPTASPSPQTKESFARRQPRRKTAEILLKLSHSCNLHLKSCHCENNTNDATIVDDDDRIPLRCENDLENLRNLLPQIELKFRPPQQGEKGPSADDVVHLCAFYNSTIQSLYCPYAPRLLEQGKSMEQVMKRVMFLFRHVITPAVVATAEREASGDLVNLLEAPQSGFVVDTISQTAARFLSFLLDPSVRPCILTDLVDLLEDLAFLCETKVLPVKLDLFGKSCDHSSLEMDCSLEIRNWDQLWILQSTSLMLLSGYVAFLKGKHYESSQEVPPSSTLNFTNTSWRSQHWSHGANDARVQLIPSLLASISLVLCVQDTPSASSSLCLQAKLSASNLLSRIVADWYKVAPTKLMFMECSLIVAEAIHSFMSSSTDCPAPLSASLVELLRMVVFNPPQLADQPLSSSSRHWASRAMLFSLLDCTVIMSHEDGDVRDLLEVTTLMAIQLLLEAEEDVASSVAHAISHGVLSSLLNLLRDSHLSNIVSVILHFLIEEISHASELNSLCQAVLNEDTNCERTITSLADFPSKENEETAHATTGIKRKREHTIISCAGQGSGPTLQVSPNKCGDSYSAKESGTISWLQSLRHPLKKALTGAQSIRDHSSEDIGRDGRAVLSMLRFLSRCVAKCMDSNVDSRWLDGLLGVTRVLLDGVERLIDLTFHSVCPSLEIRQIMVDASLYLHYVFGRQLLHPAHDFLKRIVNILSSTSLCVQQWLNEDIYTTFGCNRSCEIGFDLSKGGLVFLSSKPDSKDVNFLKSFLMQQSGTGRGDYDPNYVSMASLEVLYGLSLGFRCCLLASLYPGSCFVQGQSDMPNGPPRHEGPLLKKVNHRQGSPSLSAIVFLLPLRLSSIAILSQAGLSPNHDLDRLIVDSILDLMIPAAEDLESFGTDLVISLLHSAISLQNILHNSIHTCSVRLGLFEFLQSLSIGNLSFDFEYGPSNPRLEILTTFKKLVRILVAMVSPEHPNQHVRKLWWFCLAHSGPLFSCAEMRDLEWTPSTPSRDASVPNQSTMSPFMWLLRASFTQGDRSFRDETSKHLWRLVLSENNSFLLAHYCDEKQAGILSRVSSQQIHSYELENQVEAVVADFFRDVDKLLHLCVGMSDSQLSFTMANCASGASSKKVRGGDQKTSRAVERTAVRLLATFCHQADTSMLYGRFFFEKALQRLVRLWAKGHFEGSHDFSFSFVEALAFAEFRLIPRDEDAPSTWWEEFPRLMSTLISDTLLLNCNESREAQLLKLERLIISMVSGNVKEPLVGMRALLSVHEYFEDTLPAIIATFVEEKSLELLHLLPLFRKFLDERIKRAETQITDDIQVVGSSNFPDGSTNKAFSIKRRDLDKQTRKLCSEDSILNRLLPLLFLRLDPSGLTFFLKNILNEVSCKSLIEKRGQSVLKELVSELGSGPETIGPAKLAIRFAAIARTVDKPCGSSQLEKARSSPIATEFGKEWVTSHFLFLLVTVVQSKWKARTLRDRLHALRCLHEMLDFLGADEASQFFTQIMSTVNASILETDLQKWTREQDRLDAACLRLFAVRSLSKLIRMVVDVHLETIASNLTMIVVALIPVVDENGPKRLGNDIPDMVEGRNIAISLLHFLTDGALGVSLVHQFKEIPFLPHSQSMDGIHQSLRSNGIDFDNLAVLSGGGTSHQGVTSATEISTTMGSAASADAERLLALQKRLVLICGLLDHESTSVRKVSLAHLTDVLRANRATFHMLLLSEGQLSGKRFLTTVFKDATGNPKWGSRGAVAPMVEKLLSRCVSESDAEIRLGLAACIGEVGAISETLLGELQIGGSIGDEAVDSPLSSYRWRLEQPPWQSQSVKYQLLLVTRHLAAALKAAASATDQHKIAFSIQQLLFLLNSSARESDGQVDPPSADGKGGMTKWLKDQLEQSGEYDLLEPYFGAEFKEKSIGHPSQRPPFARISASYHTWMANFCRWMIYGSNSSGQTPDSWKQLFFACRTAVRTEIGLNVAEFLMPLLVVDRICFGTSEDRLLVQQELVDVFCVEVNTFMQPAEKQKAVNTAFMTIDTLQAWLDREVEERSRGRSSLTSSNRGTRQLQSKSGHEISTSWSGEESIDKIYDLLKSIPLNLQAGAAAQFGMNARGLQRLELAARAATTTEIFETSIDDQKKSVSKDGKRVLETFSVPIEDTLNIELMKDVLSRLDDCATMLAIGQESFNPIQRIQDNIRQKEASGNFEAALQDYERVLQASTTDKKRHDRFLRGSLRCLLELGRYESVLNQTLRMDDEGKAASAFAVEAARKLGRWETLRKVLDVSGEDVSSKGPTDGYQHLMGKMMLGLHHQESKIVEQCIKFARENVMQSLAAVASESYTRCYTQIVNLHVLRELEDANPVLCNNGHGNGFDLDSLAYSTAINGWSWKGRVDVATPSGALEIIGTRAGLARLNSDPVLLATLFLEAGHRARKNRRWSISEDLLSQSQVAAAALGTQERSTNTKHFQFVHLAQVQLAKVKFSCGECGVALKMLGQPIVDRAVAEMLPRMETPDVISRLAISYEQQLIQAISGTSACSFDEDSTGAVRFASRLLQLTRWTSEVGLKSSSEILGRFQLIQKLAPDWEKGHFYYAKFVDSILQARMMAMINNVTGKDGVNRMDENDVRKDVILRDRISQSHSILAMRMYATALRIDLKHVYQALPRLLSLWFDLVSVSRDRLAPDSLSKDDPIVILRQNQNQANTFMASQLREIPAVAFYTAMPQLISRVIHDDPEASMVVKSILQRLLVKFPHQAMWPLAWLEGSKVSDRKRIGIEIFLGAQKSLSNNHRSSSKLIEVSSNLFDYLRKTATCDAAPGRGNQIRIKPWHHPEVDLSEFLPPIQAALAISPTSMDHMNARDHFSRTVPKMRVFSERVRVMASKAKPKRMKAYAVPGTYRASSRQRTPQASSADADIGELHFLVKQEAKGDLRKDARVQDLNNVINRLMCSNNWESGASSRRRRRLHLRTFAVTCLSEDIGILEWVPDTDSLRNLVMKSYNPQTSESCPRRRGNRLANFSDANLRSYYEMCQNKFFKEGNLSRAASLFEDHCLRPFPPLLWWWFQQTFHDPHAWYEARNRFTLSAAAWSAVGHVIGLGDRHSENILVDTKSGDCVHVDFDCIFDKGLNLPRPEVVPFRLTANMLDAFGPSGASGIYTDGLQTAMRTLRDNRDTLLSVLEPFLKDPVIDWKRHRNQQKASSSEAEAVHSEKQTLEAKRSIQVIDERLRGIYNLRNPNLKKYRRRDHSTDQEDEYDHFVSLPVEGQVQRMISEATSTENLVQLYVGWMPWV